MPMPRKSYFHLREIEKRWSVSTSDIACYVLDGLLEIAVWTMATKAEAGQLLCSDGAWHYEAMDYPVLNGPQAVISADLWPVFRTGTGRIEQLKPLQPDTYRRLAGGPLLVTLEDLLVTREERDRFERVCELALEPDALQPNERPADGSAFRHSAGYAKVFLSGVEFDLGPRQASVVKQLDEARQRGEPWVHQNDLMSGAKAKSPRLVDLFRGKANWRTLIRGDDRGSFRLNLPDAPVRSHNRAYRKLGRRMALAR